MSESEQGVSVMPEQSQILLLLGEMKGQLTSIDNLMCRGESEIKNLSDRMDVNTKENRSEFKAMRDDYDEKFNTFSRDHDRRISDFRTNEFDPLGLRVAKLEKRQAWIAGAAAVVTAVVMTIARPLLGKLLG